ncbi:helix-turn-helix domain-containing protein [Vibrio splendidus]|uniref:helix-turn-helix domain-containing protein n=1 Tax=Vibrio splendidus TaxID=29497 RepID=UPI00352DFA0B
MTVLKKSQLGRPRKHSAEFVERVKALANEGYTQRSIADYLKISVTTVNYMINDKYFD